MGFGASRRDHEGEDKYEPPPPYQGAGYYGHAAAETASLNDDGRIDIDLDSKLSRTLCKILPPPSYTSSDEFATSLPTSVRPTVPRLNIVVQVVGSRGDVQPFVALGVALQQKHGHRIRLATHNVFESFVRDAGLEFYPIGGDPAKLMAYIVKNPGLIPSMKSLRAGDVAERRKALGEMLDGCWLSCIAPDQRTGHPFVANAIIANPPSFAHVHCAQALGVPLHIMFTMPWTCTRAFPHPLTNLKMAEDSDLRVANYLSYKVVDWMTWQCMGDIVNRWRRRTLDLEEVPYFEGPSLVENLNIPHTYCWSPALVPRPRDWPPNVDVCGFFFREPPDYKPPPDLEAFLQAGDRPVYIGFGSIVLDNVASVTSMVVEAVKRLGIRAVVSRGWSSLGKEMESNNSIFFLDDCPHEWLFQHVSAVVHHGGAGTTACGLRNGKPTVVVPFFGDQPFWGAMVASAGAGSKPLPHRSLTTGQLTDAIAYCLTSEAQEAAFNVMVKMQHDAGVDAAVDSFHRQLPQDLACDLLPSEAAGWKVKHGGRSVKLSPKAFACLAGQGLVDRKALNYLETKPITIDPQRYDPTSATMSIILHTVYGIGTKTVDIVLKPMQELTHPDAGRVVAGPSRTSSRPSHSDSQRLATMVHTGGADETSTRATEATAERAISTTSISTEDVGHGASEARSNTSATSKFSSSRSARAVVAGSKAVGSIALFSTKTLLVDFPLATTEGLRAIPGRTYDRERALATGKQQITGIASGVTAAYKNFGIGMYEAATSVFSHTYAGKKREGALGVAKGLGMGLGDLVCKTSAASIGLVAYPMLGGWRSLHKLAHHRARDAVVDARLLEGEWLLSQEGEHSTEVREVVQRFSALTS